jgi:hypothetical protein
MKRIFEDVVSWIVIAVATLIPIFILAMVFLGVASLFSKPACAMEKLGTISRNPFIGDSTSNPFSLYNNPFNPNSPYNEFGPYGNRFSPYSANNPYSTQSPGIYGYADEGRSSDNYSDYSDPYGDGYGDSYGYGEEGLSE